METLYYQLLLGKSFIKGVIENPKKKNHQ